MKHWQALQSKLSIEGLKSNKTFEQDQPTPAHNAGPACTYAPITTMGGEGWPLTSQDVFVDVITGQADCVTLTVVCVSHYFITAGS